MSDEFPTPTDPFFPTPDPSRSENVKPADVRKDQVERGKRKVAARGDDGVTRENPIVNDATYGTLREDERVVMRHTIALNIDNFRASSEEFTPRPAHKFPALAEAAPPFFSVVIPTYNGQRHMPAVLDALRRQTLTDFEVIVVDDASSDDTVALVERRYPEVRLLVSRQNRGFAAACNSGAAAANGRILVLLNNDTEPDAHWLEELARAIVANPQAASFASKLLLFDRRTMLHTAGDVLGRDGVARNRGVWEHDRGQYDAETSVFSACGGAAAYRRDVWQALGGFDESFWMYLEDVDYGFRARLAGWDAVFVPGARVYHHLSASGGDTLASYYVGRNTIWTIARNMPSRLLWRNLVAIVASQLGVTIDALRNIRGEAARARLRGQLAGLMGWRHQMADRHIIQQRRLLADADLERLLK